MPVANDIVRCRITDATDYLRAAGPVVPPTTITAPPAFGSRAEFFGRFGPLWHATFMDSLRAIPVARNGWFATAHRLVVGWILYPAPSAFAVLWFTITTQRCCLSCAFCGVLTTRDCSYTRLMHGHLRSRLLPGSDWTPRGNTQQHRRAAPCIRLLPLVLVR